MTFESFVIAFDYSAVHRKTARKVPTITFHITLEWTKKKEIQHKHKIFIAMVQSTDLTAKEKTNIVNNRERIRKRTVKVW